MRMTGTITWLRSSMVDRRRSPRSIICREAGLGSEHLGIAVRGDDTVDFEHDADAELVEDIGDGVKIGAPIGALAGMTLAAAALPGTILGVGGVLAIGGVSALWGALLGGYLGAGRGSSAWNAHQQLLLTALHEGQVLVVVCDHGRRTEIERIFEHHGGRLFPLDASLSA